MNIRLDRFSIANAVVDFFLERPEATGGAHSVKVCDVDTCLFTDFRHSFSFHKSYDSTHGILSVQQAVVRYRRRSVRQHSVFSIGKMIVTIANDLM